MITPTLEQKRKISWLVLSLPWFAYVLIGYAHQFDLPSRIFMLRHTGYWAFGLFIFLSSLNPLILAIPRWAPFLKFFNQFRRAMGVAAFVYACLHVTCVISRDITQHGEFAVLALFLHPVLLPGFITWCILLPLALTSNLWCKQKLGPRWKKLHLKAHLAQKTLFFHLLLQFGQQAIIALIALPVLFYAQYLRKKKM